MKRSQLAIIVLFAALVLALSAFNIYITVHSKKQVNQLIRASVQESQDQTIHYIDATLSETIGDIKEIQGPPGPQGAPGESIQGPKGKDGIVRTEIVQQPPEKAKDGKDGKNGRTPMFTFDPETCNFMMKYEDDVLWNVLIEGNKLIPSCKGSEE